MFAKETYMQRRALLKKKLGSGVLLFLGNDECGLNYEDNTFRYRQDSTFLYYFGLSCAGLSAIIDIDEDKEIIFGDELSIDAIVWMGLHYKKNANGWAWLTYCHPQKLSAISINVSRKGSQYIICLLTVPNIS